MTEQGKPLWRLTPEEAASAHGMTVEELKERAEPVYLMADLSRTEQKFRNLWNRWASGKSNMPLAVETALVEPESVEQCRLALAHVRRAA